MKDFYLITASFVGEIKRDFRGYVKMAAKAGYAGLELFNCIYGGFGPQELKNYLASYGMTAISAHVNVEDTDSQLSYLAEAGCRYVVCPMLRVESRDDAYRKAELLNALGQKAKAAGLRYAYHNHDNDFDVYDGKTVIDIFLENTDPKLVTFELDAAWAWRAGVDAADFVNRHAGRFDLIHVKETSRVLGPEDDMHALFAGAKREPDGRFILTPEM